MNRFLLLPFRLGVVAVLLSLAWSGYAQTITTFDMPNSTFTQPSAINAAGQITGSYGDSLEQHGFLRKADGTLISFDAPLSYPAGPAARTGATSINAAGVIIGYVYHPTDVSFGFLRQTDGTLVVFGAGRSGVADCFGPTEDAFTPQALGTGLVRLEGTVPAAINDRGQIAGVCGPAADLPFGFLRQPHGAITVFAVPTKDVGNPWTRAQGINSRGQITGVYCCDPTFNQHAFLREPDGTLTIFDTPTLNGQFTTPIPTAINAHGQITGYSSLASDSSTSQGFLRQRDGSIAMFAVPNSISTLPAAMNSEGQITGVYLDSSNVSHGFVRDANGCITTIDVPNASNTYPTGINQRGEITGWYSDTIGVHGFVRSR